MIANMQTKSGHTGLHLAAMNGDADCVHVFLYNKADPDLPSTVRASSLSLSTSFLFFPPLSLSLLSRAPLSFPSSLPPSLPPSRSLPPSCPPSTLPARRATLQDGETPLLAAIANGHAAVVRRLLEYRANLDVKGKVSSSGARHVSLPTHPLPPHPLALPNRPTPFSTPVSIPARPQDGKAALVRAVESDKKSQGAMPLCKAIFASGARLDSNAFEAAVAAVKPSAEEQKAFDSAWHAALKERRDLTARSLHEAGVDLPYDCANPTVMHTVADYVGMDVAVKYEEEVPAAVVAARKKMAARRRNISVQKVVMDAQAAGKPLSVTEIQELLKRVEAECAAAEADSGGATASSSSSSSSSAAAAAAASPSAMV